jgi:hypothetical protein
LPGARQLRGAVHEPEQCPGWPVTRSPKRPQGQIVRISHACGAHRGFVKAPVRHRGPGAALAAP